MKLFFIEGTGRAGHETAFVHADSARQACEVAYKGYRWPKRSWVYDLSQTALCAGVLDLAKVPMERIDGDL